MNHLFYHSYCIEGSKDIFMRLYMRIKATKLFDSLDKIHVVNVGPNKEEQHNSIKELSKVESVIRDVDSSEAETLKLLWEFCQQSNNCNICYLHSKGITHKGNRRIEQWRDYLQFMTIDEWRENIKALESYSMSGCNYYGGKNPGDFAPPHYSGNYWWARSSYIKQLPKIESNHDRLKCEYWPVDNKKENKKYCIFDSKVDHYNTDYPREYYVNYRKN